MLFMCHQMAMKKEANDKLKAQALRRAQNAVDVPIIWVLGGPGCGKGTQCLKIVEKYGFTHLSTGDLIRAEVASGSDKGRELEKKVKLGELVANEAVLCILENAIRISAGQAKGFIIDGYPREKQQGVEFETKIAPVDIIIFFECSDETLIQRILARASASLDKRVDDNDAAIMTRISTFHENTNFILSQYSQKTVTIQAERSVAEIFLDVERAIDCMLQKRTPAVCI